jgi:hypothetical protein
MLVLASTTDTLEVDLIAAHTANALPFLVSYRDITTTAYTPGRQFGTTNGTTDVQLLAAPAASTQRVVDFIQIRNRDTVSHTVTVRFVDNTTEYDIFTATIATGEMIQYADGTGWSVLSNNGSTKTAQAQGTNSVSSGLNTVTITADVTNNNATANTIADVTGLSFPVTNGQRYWFRFVIQYTAAATTTGSRWTINGPTQTELRYKSEYSLTTTTNTVNEGVSAYDSPAASSASSAATASNIAIIEGFILPSADGNVIARFASEISSSAIVAKRGSFVQYLAVG